MLKAWCFAWCTQRDSNNSIPPRLGLAENATASSPSFWLKDKKQEPQMQKNAIWNLVFSFNLKNMNEPAAMRFSRIFIYSYKPTSTIKGGS